MLALAVQIKSSPEQGIKRTKISVGVQAATLKYNSTLSEHFWLMQLLDMFDVKDDIVPGYTPFTNLTEFQIHLWDCAIDYRPLHYPFRAVATFGTLTISSNIVTGSNGCTLRFVAEESALCLAPQKVEANERIESNKISALPATELVCVADLGLFEISLRLNDKVTPLSPKNDLRASIMDLHIRTSSDAAKALLEFIVYLTNEDDMADNSETRAQTIDRRSSSLSTSSTIEPEDELLQMNKSDRSVPEVAQQHVNTLMADAMEENIEIPIAEKSSDSDEPVDLGADVFFFPDEQTKRIMTASSGAIRKSEGYKRRCASEDSISIDSSSYRDDEDIFVRRFEQKDEDTGSVDTELGQILNFETSIMMSYREPHEEFDPLPQVEMDLGDISKCSRPAKPAQPVRKVSSGSDDDFCFVAGEERPAYADVPVVRSDDPIRIIDNHYDAPKEKPDLLRAPANFPMAVHRYTLCDLTMVWHMYGGRDFPTDDDKKKEQEERDET